MRKLSQTLWIQDTLSIFLQYHLWKTKILTSKILDKMVDKKFPLYDLVKRKNE